MSRIPNSFMTFITKSWIPDHPLNCFWFCTVFVCKISENCLLKVIMIDLACFYKLIYLTTNMLYNRHVKSFNILMLKHSFVCFSAFQCSWNLWWCNCLLVTNKGYTHVLTLLKNKSLVNCFLQEREATMLLIEKMIVG